MRTSRLFMTMVLNLALLVGPAVGVAGQSDEAQVRPPVPSAGCGTSEAEAGTHDQSISVSGRDERFAVHLPEVHDGQTPVPLWVQLHGVSGSGSAQVNMLAGDADEQGFIVAGPHAYLGNAGWTWREEDPELDVSLSNPDIALVNALIDHLADELCLDLARVYVAGHSGGGEGASVLACVLEDKVAAAASVAAMLDVGDDCDLDRPVPYLAVHGTADNDAYFDGGVAPGYNDFPVVQAMAQTPIPERLANVAERNGCDPGPSIEVLTDAVESWAEPVERWTWVCPTGAEVELLVHGRGHSWPAAGNVGFDGTALVWDFFEQHPMPE